MFTPSQPLQLYQGDDLSESRQHEQRLLNSTLSLICPGEGNVKHN